MRVLVVDDDPDQVIVRCMLLAHHGFETTRAGDPVAALGAIREHLPDIVVVDLRLPTEQDGLQLIRELKKSFPGVQVVVLTGSNAQKLKSKPELQDVADVIEKGTSCKALLDTLARIAALTEPRA